MNVQLKEDDKMARGLVYSATAVFVTMFIAIGVKFHSPGLIVVSFFLALSAWWVMRPGPPDSVDDPKWWLSDSGLEREYQKGRETIRWNQIVSMKWARYAGLTVRWNESNPDQRSEDFKSEFKYDSLNQSYIWTLKVQRDDASQIISAWKIHSPQHG